MNVGYKTSKYFYQCAVQPFCWLNHQGGRGAAHKTIDKVSCKESSYISLNILRIQYCIFTCIFIEWKNKLLYIFT